MTFVVAFVAIAFKFLMLVAVFLIAVIAPAIFVCVPMVFVIVSIMHVVAPAILECLYRHQRVMNSSYRSTHLVSRNKHKPCKVIDRHQKFVCKVLI